MIRTPPRLADPRPGKRRTFEMTPKRERCIWMDPREASGGKPRMKTECAGYGRRPPRGGGRTPWAGGGEWRVKRIRDGGTARAQDRTQWRTCGRVGCGVMPAAADPTSSSHAASTRPMPPRCAPGGPSGPGALLAARPRKSGQRPGETSWPGGSSAVKHARSVRARECPRGKRSRVGTHMMRPSLLVPVAHGRSRRTRYSCGNMSPSEGGGSSAGRPKVGPAAMEPRTAW